jgi:hypothetical protein
MYELTFRPTRKGLRQRHEVARPGKRTTTGRWNTYDLTAEGDHLVVQLNSKTTVDVRDSQYARGVIALQNYKGEGGVKFRNVKLQPLGLKSAFNGKDLSGWKEIVQTVYCHSRSWLNVRTGMAICSRR